MKIAPLAIALTTIALTIPAFAKQDHAAEYQAGTFSSTGQLSDGSIAQCAGSFCNTRGAAHNIHYIRTDEGMYVIEAPVNVGMSLLSLYATSGVGPILHKEWFMDQLHEGDKVLFRAKCNKHNDCRFALPNPEHPEKEYATVGVFRPDHATTNTAALCASGKLNPATQAQVCPVAAVTPAAAPVANPAAYAPVPVPASVTAPPAPVASQYRPEPAPPTEPKH